jgi:putative peptide zinc metalloprotease protein
VDALARRLAPLASWPMLGLQLSVGVGGYAQAAGDLGGGVGPGGLRFGGSLDMMALSGGLFLLSALWHELGHAAALRREGYPAGNIGAGVLFVVPVLYCDVTPVAALTRTGRVRVDLAGIAFQLGAGGVCAALGAWLGHEALLWAALAALLVVGWNLLPFLRTDASWLLADLVGLDSLDRPITVPSDGGVRPARPDRGGVPVRYRLLAAFMVLHRLATVVFLAALVLYLPWRLAGRLPLERLAELLPAALRPPLPVVRGSIALLAVALVVRVAARSLRLLKSVRTDLWMAAGRRPDG